MALRCRLARLAAGAHGPVAARALGGWGLPGAELPQSAPTHRGFTLLAAVAGWGGPNTADVARGSAASPGLSAGSVQLEGRTQLAAANTLGGLMLRGLSTQAAADFTDYSVIGKIQESFEEPAAPTVFAVVEVGAHQFKVAAGDIITTEKLIGLDVNDKVTLNKVLMLGTAEETVIGKPPIVQDVLSLDACSARRVLPSPSHSAPEQAELLCCVDYSGRPLIPNAHVVAAVEVPPPPHPLPPPIHLLPPLPTLLATTAAAMELPRVSVCPTPCAPSA